MDLEKKVEKIIEEKEAERLIRNKLSRTKTQNVMVHLEPHVKKLLNIEAVKRGCTQGSLVGEAILMYFKWLRKSEIDEQKERREQSRLETLKAELADIQRMIDEYPKERKQGKFTCHTKEVVNENQTEIFEEKENE